jgi:tyrosyl-tRNA synthetase
MIYKKKLAFALTKQLNSEEAAEQAAKAFESRVQDKELPENIEEIEIESNSNSINVSVALSLAHLTSSTSEAKRLISQKGVSVDNKLVENYDQEIDLSSEHILQVGRKFRKIKKK